MPDLIREPSAIPPAIAAAAVLPINMGCFILLAADPIVSPTPFTNPATGFERRLDVLELLERPDRFAADRERGGLLRLVLRRAAEPALREDVLRRRELADVRRLRVVPA